MSLYRKKYINPYAKIGQGIVEYAVLLAFVFGALIMMRMYFQRGIQANIKLNADIFANQSLWRESGGTLQDSWGRNFEKNVQHDQVFAYGERISSVASESFMPSASFSSDYHEGY
jgi:hypothetical protein